MVVRVRETREILFSDDGEDENLISLTNTPEKETDGLRQWKHELVIALEVSFLILFRLKYIICTNEDDNRSSGSF